MHWKQKPIGSPGFAEQSAYSAFRIGKKTYTKKVKSGKKTQKITFSIKQQPAGKKIKVTYYDKYKNKKDSASDIVYYGDRIYVGMSSKNALLTTWGKPVRRNKYDGLTQWVFEDGETTLYVYISKGVVTSIQEINY